MSSGTREETTKHILVREYVEAKIRSGDLQPGDRIPTENELMQELHLSRTPIRQALIDLASDGWIYRIRGSGSYVRRRMHAASVDIYAILYSNQRGIEKDIIHGMRRAVLQHDPANIHLILKHPGSDTSQLIDVVNQIPRGITGGLVVIPTVSPERPLNRLLGASLRKISDEKFHVVQLDRCVPEYDGHFVTSNHRMGASRMTEYLLSMGHTRIGCVYEHPENTSIRDRLDGVKTALLKHSLRHDPNLMMDIATDEVADRATDVLTWVTTNRISAIFCCESELAREIHSVLVHSGVRVPDDVSLCSFDDHAFADADNRFLTAVVQKLEDLGHFAIEIILNSLAHKVSGPIKMTLEPELAIRRSVAYVPRNP